MKLERREDRSLFEHGGEMGALMGRIDWAETPLGPVPGWSQALRTMVGLLLRNRFPLLLWWGPRFVQLYNDAYRPIPGDKHPRSMGQPASECWPEIWHIIGPMIEAPFRGEPATWSDDLPLTIDRRGFWEETHFKVAYSPVPDESVPSGIGGVLATVAEITEEVYARRQLATLRDLAAMAAGAKTAEQACTTAARTMEGNPRDIPRARFFLFDGEHGSRRLVACTGSGQLELEREAPALELPLAAASEGAPVGVLEVTPSSHRALDEGYRSFFALAADHVASAVRNARAYQQERERAEKLAEIDRAKTAFFSNVSHEFRTPLTLMLAPIEDLRMEALPEAQRERVDLLHRNANRLLKLVNNLLDFARIEAGRAEASYEPTDLARATAELASNFRSAVERVGIELVVDCPPLPEPVWVDGAMWEKIVLNLLSNAFKFTFEGSIAVRLRARAERVELEVADTGTGIAEKELPRLFERFHRIESARGRSHEGSGIGLALVHELVRLHGGEVTARSREGEGTTFLVSLPRGRSHLPRERTRAEKGLASTSTAASAYVQEASGWSPAGEVGPSQPMAPPRADGAPRARILVADDNADMRDYVSRLLREHWDVESVADGHQALDAMRKRPPDLVVSDVMMPGLDGFGLLRHVRQDPALRATPFLLLSARAGQEAASEGLGAGADDYLVKPFTARDLLVRVGARLAAARQAAAVDAQRTNLYSAFVQAPFPVVVLRGPNHVLEAANTAVLEAWGKSARIIGMPLLEALPEIRDQRFPELLDQVFRTGTPYHGREELARLPDGAGEVFFTYVYAPIRGVGGGVEGVMVCAFDVTEQILARREAEREARAKDEFLATMSHELRTPLNAMLGWAKMLRDGPRDASRLDRGLDVILRNVRAQERLIGDLLDVSRITSGKLRLNVKPTDVVAVLCAAMDVVRPAAAAKGVILNVEMDRAAEPIQADPDRLQQIVWNLMTNAIRFTPAGGVVTLGAAKTSEGRLRLRVADTGVGIAAEHLPHVFERFRQVDSSTTRKHGGLGLGLAIVRHLAEAHGGSVSVESDGPGRGSTFNVDLPYRAAQPEIGEESRAPESRPRAAPVDGSLRGLRVLLVDDDGDAREMLGELLGAAGASVTRAANAREALEAPGPFDVIVSDIAMPEVDGYDLMRRVRSREGDVHVPAIALSAYTMRAKDAQLVSSAGFRKQLRKPVEPGELIAEIRACAREP